MLTNDQWNKAKKAFAEVGVKRAAWNAAKDEDKDQAKADYVEAVTELGLILSGLDEDDD